MLVDRCKGSNIKTLLSLLFTLSILYDIRYSILKQIKQLFSSNVKRGLSLFSHFLWSSLTSSSNLTTSDTLPDFFFHSLNSLEIQLYYWTKINNLADFLGVAHYHIFHGNSVFWAAFSFDNTPLISGNFMPFSSTKKKQREKDGGWRKSSFNTIREGEWTRNLFH